MCSVCLKSDHRFRDCPFVVFGGNISSVRNSRPSTYANVTKVVSVSRPPPADAPVPVLKDPVKKSDENHKKAEVKKNEVEKNKENEKNEEDEMDEDEEDEENEDDEKDGEDEDHLDEGTWSHDCSGVQERERDSCGGADEHCSPGDCASGVSAQVQPQERWRERDRSRGGDRKCSKTPGHEDRQSLSDDKRGKWQIVNRRR
ncbi:luc7-like protein 3 [Montipora foliosa]|uniref:luc7-like protein 3 n=1 Tax=Montipora foliosa TaxID=591990 RepID=UPI0035F1FF2A